MDKPIRILIGKPGLDGHDRGAKVVAQALRDAGMEVVYTGLHKSVDQIITTAVQEDVEVIGLSILSGAHLPICEKLMGKLRQAGLTGIRVVVGGVIPVTDVPKLRDLGVNGIFPSGSSFTEIVEYLEKHRERRDLS